MYINLIFKRELREHSWEHQKSGLTEGYREISRASRRDWALEASFRCQCKKQKKRFK